MMRTALTDSAGTKYMTQLDRLLYEWIAQSDQRRFDLAFQRYSLVAYPAVQRFLINKGVSLTRADCEELANDALLAFFNELGLRRRQSARLIRQEIEQFSPFSLDQFHVRTVKNWTNDAAFLCESLMSFAPPSETDVGTLDVTLKSSVLEANQRIPSLQRRGCLLINEAKTALEDAGTFRFEAPLMAGDDDDTKHALLFAEAIAAAKLETCIGAPEQGRSGIIQFTVGAGNIIKAFPEIAIPSNGLLFRIAENRRNDRYKYIGAAKRGGPGRHPVGLRAPETASTGNCPHPLLDPILDADSSFDDRESVRVYATTLSLDNANETVLDDSVVDPALEYERHDLYAKFIQYLREPLDEAERAVVGAPTNGSAKRAHLKVAAETNKFQFVMRVLEMLGEGCTQQAIAEELDVTRNQVKYVAEKLEPAYERFASEFTRWSNENSSSGDQNHVR
jgi:hypothetical protein